MKSNAVFRIVLWSLVIVMLIGVLQWGMGGFRRVSLNRSVAPASTTPPIRVDSDSGVDPEAVYTALEPLNIRSAPSPASPVVGMLEKGDTVYLTKTEEISGVRWGYIIAPESGWIAMDFIQIQSTLPETASYTEVPVTDSSAEPEAVYTVPEPLDVRFAPSQNSDVVAMLETGVTVSIDRTETIAGTRWAYITEPETGWIVMDFIQTQSPLPGSESAAIDGPGSGYGRQPQGLKEINIEWALGDITIQSGDVERIEVREINRNDGKVGDMVINNSDSKLSIRYSEKASWNLGISVTDTMAKDLYVTVPLGFSLDTLEVDAASAILKVENMTIRDVDFDGASGTCDFVNCHIDTMDLDTASGDITFRGSLDQLDCDAASASVSAVFENVPSRIDMDSMSGDLDITLPETAGFTVSMDGLNCDFVSDFGYSVQKNGAYYRGDGACKITMDAMSGDVYVRKYMETAVMGQTVSDSSPAFTCQEHGETCPDPSVCAENASYCQIHGADCDDPSHCGETAPYCEEHGADCDGTTHHTQTTANHNTHKTDHESSSSHK